MELSKLINITVFRVASGHLPNQEPEFSKPPKAGSDARESIRKVLAARRVRCHLPGAVDGRTLILSDHL